MSAHQAPLSLGFSRQEHWSGLPFPSPAVTLTSALLRKRDRGTPISQIRKLRLQELSSGCLFPSDAPCLSHAHGCRRQWPGSTCMHVCTRTLTHTLTRTYTHTLPPLQGHNGFSSAEVGVRSAAWFFQLLLLPKEEGGRNGAGGRRGVGCGWRGEVVGGCLFHGRMGFSLETLLPSTPSLAAFSWNKGWGWTEAGPTCQPALAPEFWPQPHRGTQAPDHHPAS